MDIVCCLDNNYVMPCGVLLCSICENNKDELICFHLIINGVLKEERKHSLWEIVARYNQQVVFYTINDKLLSICPIGKKGQPIHITLAAYTRLFVTEVLPTHLNKVLYLDCDIIVRNSLKALWNTNLEGYAVGAVPDLGTDLPYHYNRLKYPFSFGYFNSGVLLINLSYWRNSNLVGEYVKYVKEHSNQLKYHDQDILNAVLYNKKKELPYKYNVLTGFLYRELPNLSWEKWEDIHNAARNACILHFAGMQPWYKECDNPYKEEFIKYWKLTKWKVSLKHARMGYKNRVKHMLAVMRIVDKTKNKYLNNLLDGDSK